MKKFDIFAILAIIISIIVLLIYFFASWVVIYILAKFVSKVYDLNFNIYLVTGIWILLWIIRIIIFNRK